jgi:hypothetical protein
MLLTVKPIVVGHREYDILTQQIHQCCDKYKNSKEKFCEAHLYKVNSGLSR